MSFDPTTDSWAPGETPVGNASVLPPDNEKPTGAFTPQSGDFVSDLKGRSDKVSGALAGEYGKYTQATSVLDQMEQSRIERDRTRMEQSFNMESAAANDPALNHPWNADKERSERIKGPLENFGSVATIFALAASAFTRTPMNSALTAAGAAMTAMHQNDEEGYKSAYEAWKSNSDLAIKRFNIERSLYEDANKLVTTDTNLWRQKRAAIAAQFDDQKRLIMLENGMDAEVLKADEAWTKAGEQAIDYQKKFEELNLVKDISQQKFAEWKQAHPRADPNNPTPQENLVEYKAKNEFMLEAKREVAEAGRAGLRTGAGAMPTANRLSAGDLEKEIQEKIKSGELQQKDVADYRAKRSGELKTEAQGTGKTDAAITNTLSMYPGMSKGDLGYISPTAQPKLIIALRDSPENLETIAGYAKAHPESIGLIADATKRINLDAYQALFKSDPAAAKAKLDVDRDAAIDQVVKEKKLDLSQAAQAKVLQKLLTTQAFTDAALAGSRGATIYLDKAFREIYDPTSSPGAFFSILEKRYDEADRQAEKYKLGFDRRSDEALAKMPFWQQKAAGFAGKEFDKPPAPGAKQAKDGNWYVPDPDRPGKFLMVK